MRLKIDFQVNFKLKYNNIKRIITNLVVLLRKTNKKFYKHL